MPNRTQALVLGFIVFAWLSLIAILVTTPQIYDAALKLPPGDHRLADGAFLVALTAFLALLSIAVLRRWRWAFWLIVVAFLFGILRVPMAILQLANVLPREGPTWYALFQGMLGVIQFAIALAMLRGYRRSGTWGAF